MKEVRCAKAVCLRWRESRIMRYFKTRSLPSHSLAFIFLKCYKGSLRTLCGHFLCMHRAGRTVSFKLSICQWVKEKDKPGVLWTTEIYRANKFNAMKRAVTWPYFVIKKGFASSHCTFLTAGVMFLVDYKSSIQCYSFGWYYIYVINMCDFFCSKYNRKQNKQTKNHIGL